MKEYNLNIKTNKFGKYIELGEEGRGRKYAKVPYLAGDDKDVRVDFLASGAPVIVAGLIDSPGWIARISCEGVYTRSTEGWAYVYWADKKKVEVIASGNGAYGEAGRIGFWADYLLEIQANTVFMIKLSGGHKTPFYYLHFLRDEVVRIEQSDVALYCAKLGNAGFNPDPSNFIKINLL